MKKRLFKKGLLFSVLILLSPVSSGAAINCSETKPDMSIWGTVGSVSLDESSAISISQTNNAKVSVKIRTDRCMVKTPIPDHPQNAYLYALTENCNCFDGKEADIWVYARSGADDHAYYWYIAGKGWKKSDTPLPTFQGPLKTINKHTVLSDSELPAGNYTVTFAIDDNKDQILNKTYAKEVVTQIVQDTSNTYNYNGNCKFCHGAETPDRHHQMAVDGIFECIDCHYADTTGLQIIRDCHYCHDQPDQYLVKDPKPVKPVPTVERHHLKTADTGWDCASCH